MKRKRDTSTRVNLAAFMYRPASNEPDRSHDGNDSSSMSLAKRSPAKSPIRSSGSSSSRSTAVMASSSNSDSAAGSNSSDTPPSAAGKTLSSAAQKVPAAAGLGPRGAGDAPYISSTAAGAGRW